MTFSQRPRRACPTAATVAASVLAKPEYPTPQDAPEVKAVIDDINMGNWGSPRIPMFVFQGAAGWIEGTPASPSMGPGDGIMVAKDVRTLVRQYCEAGTQVEYREYPFAGATSSRLFRGR